MVGAVNSHMQRSKVLAVAAALVSAGAAVLFLAGGASAAEWHVYSGDIYAGHAYGLEVPADAEAVEILFEGPEGATAKVGLYDPAGAKLGHYLLGAGVTSASLANPDEGRHVIYVYEITEGALQVRVNSALEPTLDLQQMPLFRTDVKIGALEAPQALDKSITSKLPAEPVFLTLLYEGSARNLDATVASEKGDVVTIADETGTAFSPGVWSSLTGTRTTDAGNLLGNVYTVTLHADSFEGTLYLTSLSVDFQAPVPAPAPKPLARENVTMPSPWIAGQASTFALEEGKAYAFSAPAGELLLANPVVQESEEEAEDRRDHYDIHDMVAIYAPDDTLVELVVLDHETHEVNVTLPVAGEYVAYVYEADEDHVLAMLPGAPAPGLRELALATEEIPLETTGGEATFTVANAPVLMEMDVQEDLALLSYADVSNEKGSVLYYQNLAGLGPMMIGGWGSNIENFAAGEHTLVYNGMSQATFTIVSTYFVRDAGEVVEVVEVDPVEEGEEEAEEEAEEAGEESEEHEAPFPPMPPMEASMERLVELLNL